MKKLIIVACLAAAAGQAQALTRNELTLCYSIGNYAMATMLSRQMRERLELDRIDQQLEFEITMPSPKARTAMRAILEAAYEQPLRPEVVRMVVVDQFGTDWREFCLNNPSKFY